MRYEREFDARLKRATKEQMAEMFNIKVKTPQDYSTQFGDMDDLGDVRTDDQINKVLNECPVTLPPDADACEYEPCDSLLDTAVGVLVMSAITFVITVVFFVVIRWLNK